MIKGIHRKNSRPQGKLRQKGVLTTFTGVLILLMLTLMMVFAVRVGVFEQKSSANEMRQKLAFHAAESGIQHAKYFLMRNSVFIASDTVDLLPDGTDGWLAAGALRWSKCSDVNLSAGRGGHPCYGDSDSTRRAGSYFYSFGGSTELPVDTDVVLPGATDQVTVQALLCVLDIDFDATPPFQGCTTDSSVADGSYFMLTLLARGGADCVSGVCGAESLIAEPLTNFGAIGGGRGPAVPLVTKSTFPPSGTAEIVPNPNGGGLGVPMSVWVNQISSCPGGTPVDPSSGSWATCEAHEWYEENATPDGVVCSSNCSCTKQESISYTHGSDNILGIDLVADDQFPCDLFAFFFGIPRADYEAVKSLAQVITDCTTLGVNSFGIYWATGDECRINSNTTVGSPGAPVLLISAAKLTKFNGGAVVHGLLFVTDVEEPTAEFQSNGTNTVYGAAIIDGLLGSYTGTFQIVYNETNVQNAAGQGALGAVAGGWSDFHSAWQ